MQNRSRILKAWHALMQQHSEDLAKIITSESGKPLAEAKGEVDYAASYMEWFAEEAIRVCGEVIPSPAQGKHLLTRYIPLGPTLLITPFNFPLAMFTRKLAPALAAGNTCILKPSPETPLSAFAMAELGRRAGIPDGVFRVLSAGRDRTADIVTGEDGIMEDARIRKVSFTGSTQVGKILIKHSSSTVKRVSMELGGNAPFIVFDDADISNAIHGLIQSKFRNAGQTCVSANRIYVHKDIESALVEKLKEATRFLRMGNGFSEGVSVGPLISRQAVEKVKALVKDAEEKGASKWITPADTSTQDSKDGFYHPITILTGMTDNMRIAQEEIFGPVAAIFTFKTEEEVIQRANATPYGLAGYVFTSSAPRQWRMMDSVDVGMVGINEGMVSFPTAPFGGVKESGMGREGGSQGIKEYMDYLMKSLQVITISCQNPFFMTAASAKGPIVSTPGIGLTASMGWSSWNLYACKIDENRKCAFLRACLADNVYSKGLKFEIYSSAGTKTCESLPVSLNYEKEDAESYAEQGWDHQEIRGHAGCFERDWKTYLLQGFANSWEHASKLGNSWRTTGDCCDSFTGKWCSATAILDMTANITGYSAPGGFNNLDMLENPFRLSPFAAWSALKSPLILGDDLTKMTPEVLEMLSNEEIIAINQDPLGKSAHLFKKDGGIHVWIEELANNGPE
ncbi:hypothetical protein HDU97_002179 [Phlyctochytrium planicorne]|nr:hypothetical protein HDU97_002179 [Phlyctochytrium planicorne]